MLSLQHESTGYFSHIRRNYLYIFGKIGLTLCVLLAPLFDAPNELGQRQQISHPKDCSPSGEDHTGVRGSKAGPGCWQRSHVARGIVKCDAIFPPIVSVGENLKLLAVQRMKGMGDRENSLC